MHLIYIGSRGVLDLHTVSTGVSVALVIGAGYGAVRAAIDATKTLARLFQGK